MDPMKLNRALGVLLVIIWIIGWLVYNLFGAGSFVFGLVVIIVCGIVSASIIFISSWLWKKHPKKMLGLE